MAGKIKGKSGRPSLGERDSVLLHLPAKLKESLRIRAQEEERSLNAIVVEILTISFKPKGE